MTWDPYDLSLPQMSLPPKPGQVAKIERATNLEDR